MTKRTLHATRVVLGRQGSWFYVLETCEDWGEACNAYGEKVGPESMAHETLGCFASQWESSVSDRGQQLLVATAALCCISRITVSM